MTLNNKAIGNNIAKLRRLKDIKAADIANQLGLKEASYTKYERGETAITIDFLRKVAHILDVAPANLITLPLDSIFRYLQKPASEPSRNNLCIDVNEEKHDITDILTSLVKLNKSLLTIIRKE
jgi:transcriptional regulator with XRE-family HTH domain